MIPLETRFSLLAQSVGLRWDDVRELPLAQFAELLAAKETPMPNDRQSGEQPTRPALYWTEPYFGVSHLEGHRLLRNRTYQVTIEDYGDWRRAVIFALHSERPFSGVWTRDNFTSVEDAKLAAVEQFRLIIGEREANEVAS